MARKEKAQARVAAATVWLPKMRGQGVLVPGGFILTAAHCIEWSREGRMALGEHFTERVETADGRKFVAAVVAAEPVSDIAVLGPADPQRMLDDCEAFESF